MSPHQGSWILVNEVVERISEPESVDDYRETVFQTQQANCTYELSAVMACTRLMQAQARPNLNMERGVGKKFHPQPRSH